MRNPFRNLRRAGKDATQPVPTPPMPAEGGGSEDVNARHFDEAAGHYDDQFGLTVELARGRARHIRDHAPTPGPHAGLEVLELGCGTGNLVAALVLEGVARRCVGLDISAGMVDVARDKTRDIDGCEFVVHTAAALPFPDASFDLVVGDAFLHHVVDAAECLREVRRVLRPGGLATFNEPSRDGYAFLEAMIRIVMGSARHTDPVIDAYLSFLRFVREHEGDLAALEAYPLPDKHVFSSARLRQLADEAGFPGLAIVPSTDPMPHLWRQFVAFVLDGIQPGDRSKALLLPAADLVDETMDEAAWRHLSLHNQIYFYEPA